MRLINNMFPNAKPLKTEAGARRRIEKIAGGTCEAERVLFVIVPVEGGFQPVAILNDKTGWMSGWLAANGICVTN